MIRHMKSIRTKITLVILNIFLIFVISVLGIWYHELKKAVEHSAISNAQQLLNVSNTIFDKQVQDFNYVAALSTVNSGNHLSTNILNIMSNDSLSEGEIFTYQQNASDFLISLCCFKESLSGMMICDFQGNNISYGIVTSFSQLQEMNVSDLILNSESEVLFLPPHFASKWFQTPNDEVFSLLRPVYSFNHEKIGFVIIDIRCQLFRDCYHTGSSESDIYIMDLNTKNMLFNSANHMQGSSIGLDIQRKIMGKTSAGSGHFSLRNDKNDKFIAVYQTSTLTNWTTIITIPEENIVAAFSDTIYKIMIITVILCALLILSILVASTFLTQDIRKLTHFMATIDVNSISNSLPKLSSAFHSNDEIETLSLQFQFLLEKISQLLVHVKEEEHAKHRAELDALKFQMNPHFLYNALNAIKFLANLQGSQNISSVASSLSSMMHLNMDGRSFITIKEDKDFILSYLDIQLHHYINTFQYQVSADAELENYLIPKLIVQPLVENSIKHGLTNKIYGGILRVRYFIFDHYLKIIVEDNGKGMSDHVIQKVLLENQHINAGHIGLSNIKKRLHMYFKEPCGIQILSQEGLFTRCELTLPLIKKGDETDYV